MTSLVKFAKLPDGDIVLGESLGVLESFPADSVDFCYIDPPFMTQRERVGSEGKYKDTWDDIGSYVEFLRERLVVLRGILRDTGTVMVHIDPRTSHYVKVMMDEVFGISNFINEIVWCYNSGGAGKRSLSKKHDTILFYSKTKDYYFNIVREPYPHDYGDKPGFHPDGRMLNDWWPISFLSTRSAERCGYPTQKPLPLLERIIDIACPPGGFILDFFCGSGTTGVAALRMGRKFLLSDENPAALKAATERLSTEIQCPGKDFG
jgi:site-specific DNA-methyltransferase (adenine-specific)